MPHFFAKHLNDINYPIKSQNFNFKFEAKSLLNQNNHSLILAESSSNNILLLKQNRGDKILLKYNKNVKISSKNSIKQALREYAEITNADILSHNLNTRNIKLDNKYLLSVDALLNTINKKSKTIIEIGFGSGRHILNLAKTSPNTTFIGIEIYRPSILQVLKQIEILNLQNLFIINADCRNLFEIIPSNSINLIYIHFPIPWDKNKQKRVFSKIFLQNSLRILKKDSYIELKTDSKEYLAYVRDIAKGIKIKVFKNAKSDIISKYEARWIKQNKDIYTINFYNTKISKEIINTKISIPNNLDVKKIIESKNKKICTKEYFLHIKGIYEFYSGYILFIIFGSYYAPNSLYLVIENGNIKFIGDFIQTKANISAFNLIGDLYK
ncbi:tRNA (guanosine(46)-N7)-methyltransferase TrmB [Helicobacter sp. MIT 14-3879]|uniref:tRNA (guanosine(46)-N7)-methyltransferase TrmB n=1 Tax=Helicobacter sp. MIT 14-3879 TaxID=2040649 RepID=UPI000E1F4CEB|nr:tRNA (guanosine(46)-N7)-methyltransferase TrmB [Helicobacter sp. MIT 14-3879]RDU64735.1 tRNA (guanosine(46)-N7)-methyltransferase TrmB [Helicobacter sp. MIT 14-3879]